MKRLCHEVELVWRAFELRPEPHPALDPRGEYLTRVWESSVYPLAERLSDLGDRAPALLVGADNALA